MSRTGFYLLALTATALFPQATAQPPAGWATLKGRTVYPATPLLPVRAEVDLTHDKARCLTRGPVYDDSLIVNPLNRGIKNVVVWLRPNNPNPKAVFAANEIHPGDANRKPADVVIDQPCCQYTPRIVAARVGDTIKVKNSSSTTHVFRLSPSEPTAIEQNNIIQPDRQLRIGPLQKEPYPMPFGCTVHPWMNGQLRVFDHPYYAVTDDDGRFTIPNSPVGNYSLVVWHEKVGYLNGKAGRLGTPVAIMGDVTELKAIEFGDLAK
jgi:hypothetical protein